MSIDITDEIEKCPNGCVIKGWHFGARTLNYYTRTKEIEIGDNKYISECVICGSRSQSYGLLQIREETN